MLRGSRAARRKNGVVGCGREEARVQPVGEQCVGDAPEEPSMDPKHDSKDGQAMAATESDGGADVPTQGALALQTEQSLPVTCSTPR